ncbi:uncharacterized protein [Montipora capricornis]|uniref:uncharacterized protein isoform X1 n=2 Tax=Montipora capricornis TaxID=246305 RepID=UPI0035F11D44
MASDVLRGQKGGRTSELQENVPPSGFAVPVKRLTKVEKARLETLSAFGNCAFNSLVVKKESFRSKLKATTLHVNTAPGKETARRLTRMEKARQEANEAFKNISLGQKRKANVTEKNTGLSPVSESAKKRVTRLEKCKIEAQNADLGELTRGRKAGFEKGSLPKFNKERRKSTSKCRQSRRSSSRRKSLRQKSSTKCHRPTRVQLAQIEALQSFGGKSLDKVLKTGEKECTSNTVGNKSTDPAEGFPDTKVVDTFSIVAVNISQVSSPDVGCKSVSDSNIPTCLMEECIVSLDVKGTHQEKSSPLVASGELSDKNNVQLACNEQCQELNVSAVCKSPVSELPAEGSKSNAVSLQVVQEQERCESLCGNFIDCPKSTISTGNHCQPSVESNDLQCCNAILPETKPVTRLERARMEALQSFQGQAIAEVMKSSSRKMAKYLTPVKNKGTNTEACKMKNTPAQTKDSYIRHHPNPKKSYYSSLRDNSFCNRDALLETSKVVVSTARSLDTPTPECSPVQLSLQHEGMMLE